MIANYVALMFGVICAGVGGELFVRGTVGLARWSRISPGIVAATVAAFATSSPELSVSISSAIAGKPQIALGDALGSNVVNVALILGTALAIQRSAVSPRTHTVVLDSIRGTCSQCPGMMNSFFPSMRFLPLSIMSNILA